MSWVLRVDDLSDLARGAAFFGTGGGGDPYVGQLMVAGAIRRYGPITLVSPDELDDDAQVIPTSMMGAPSVMMEKIPAGHEAVTALGVLEAHLGVTATHTMPVECGGINSMVPLAVGAALGLPVVDGDGMGRAFPELQMETFTLFGVHGSPLVIATERGEHVIIETGADNRRMEELARAMTIRLGGMSLLASYSMTGAQAKASAIPNTIALCLSVGRALREARENHETLTDALNRSLAGSVYGRASRLLKGKVVDVERRTERGFTLGLARLAGEDGSQMEVTFQNENLIAIRDGEVAAIVPDLICIISADSYEPITTERLRYGQRIQVLAIPSPPIMNTTAGLAIFGPRAFGLDYKHSPIKADLVPVSAARSSEEEQVHTMKETQR